MSNIIIDIAAEFTGKKAFKQADTATAKLNKGVKTLARNLGLAYGTAAVLGYAKASVKAAAEDQKAQAQLALALKNVGLERNAASAESYIQRLQSEFGIVDDKLRPAYQKLAIATRNSAETQRLLNLSLDISASTGKDLEAVTSALSKAYLGSNTALSKLGIGISKADLKTKSFNDITIQLADTFKGAATTSANTLAGSIAKLGVASQNAKEIIGTGIVDALKSLGDDKSVSELASSMEAFALYTADSIRGVGLLLAEIKKLPLIGSLKPSMIPIVGAYIDILANKGAKSRRSAAVAGQKNPIQSGTYLNNPVAIKTDKVAKDTLKTNKASLALAKAKATLDLQTIQITAALKGKISEEDRLALKLQLAILTENADEATKLSERLTTLKEKNAELATKIAALPKAADPFAEWPTFIQTALAGIQDGSMTVIEKISAAVAASITLTNTAAQDSLKAGIAAGNSLAEALSGSRYAAQAAANAAGDPALLAAALKAKEEAIAASNAIILADAKKTAEAIAKIAGSSGAASAIAAEDTSTQDALKKAAEEAAAKQEALAAESEAAAKAAAEAAASQEALAKAAAEQAAALAQLLAAQAEAANAAQAAADAADAAGAPNGTTVVVNVAGSVTSEADLSAFIFDVITKMGVAGNQTVVNNRSFNTAN